MIPVLHLDRPAEKKATRIITLPVPTDLRQYTLSIGENTGLKSFTEEHANVIAASAVTDGIKVLRERLMYDSAPTFIIYNMEDQAPGLEDLLGIVEQHSILGKVPVYIYTAGLPEYTRQLLQERGRIDGIITPQTSVDDFKAMHQFASKFRQLASAQQTSRTVVKPAEQLITAKKSLNYVLKRTFDIGVSGTLLIGLSPLFLLIAALVKLGSKGPVFYTSPRAGNRYRVFKFFKFRTMVVDADKKTAEFAHLNQYNVSGDGSPVFFKLNNDPRITKLGAVLRKTSLDELPQLLNVLLGDMSLVGNRPLPLSEAVTLTSDQYAGRFNAPAGITGLWQIKKRGQANMSVSERIDLDLSYADKHSFLYDMWILAKTPSAIVQKENV